MSVAEDLIPTLAPGQWRLSGRRNGMDLVRVTFAGAKDISSVRAQLATWQRAVEQCMATELAGNPTPVPLLLPRIVRHETGGPAELRFTAPEHIGRDVLKETRSTDDVLTLLKKVAAGLDALHARHFIHGGLGLPSLWWMRDGSVRFPDAGLAHVLDRLMAVPPEAGAYVAPEVWRGGGLMPASDQYALAVIAFELFTGRKRLVRDSEGMMSVAPLTLERGEALYPGARPEMSEVLHRALSATPTARYPSCGEFIAALEGQAIMVQSLPTMHRETLRKNSGFAPRVAALALVALGAVGATTYALQRSIRTRLAPSNVALSIPEISDVAARTVRGMPTPGRPEKTSSNGDVAVGGGTTGGGRKTSRAGAAAPAAKSTTGERVEQAGGALPGARTTAGRTPDARTPEAPARVAAGAGSAARGREEPLVEQSAGARNASTLGALPLPAPARPAPVVTTGTLRLRGPSRSMYYVDGVLVKPVKGAVTVPQGEHEIDIVVPNVNSTRHRVVVHPGEVVTVQR